ncbi:hypothetical protein O181_039071 [Austropuccinia psidii MF-1]|uniref:Reverse transcriptase domain-containing protein n=1 Tax=Austropuccinia psidii MF-1 TaxID=1389203 RepID=A0A9Q3DF79_9BASI|nr:hypothetical protein [Austropuccinia psidii MF-1]
MSELPEKIPLIILDSSESPSLFVTHHTKYMDSSDSSIPLSDYFSSSKTCVDLVGYSRTPSFKTSVHIPSPNCHYLLLSSRDEVLIEIKDVGEDNSISSLHLFHGNVYLRPSSYHDSLEELWDGEEEPKEIEAMIKVLPSSYNQHLDVFSKVKEEKIPPHCSCHHPIEMEGSLPPAGVIYHLSNQESDKLRAYISENLEKCIIWPSSSSTGAPVLFVKKKDGGLHLCFDYCKINAVSKKKKYPVPPIKQLFTDFNGSSIFSQINFFGAYNLRRIKEVDEHLTAFKTKYVSSEYLVIPFRITNAPSYFQAIVNDIFSDLLDLYVAVSLYDIMGFSKSEEEKLAQVSTFLARLRANNLFAKASKCILHVSSVEYLCYSVSYEGFNIDQEKSTENSQFFSSKKPKGYSIITWF